MARMSLLSKFKKLFDPVDLTSGSISKALITFLVPIVLSMIFQQLYTLTDSMIVGQSLSEAEVAGVNSTAPLVYIVLQFGIGCTAGFSVVISEKIGMKDKDGVTRSYWVQIVLCALISVILTVVGILCIPFLLSLIGIYPSATDASMMAEYNAAYTYLFIIYAGAILQIFYNMIVSVLRAMGDSFTPFLFLVGGTILNVGLDLLFIIVFNWGVAGSAVATILSQGAAAVGAMIYGYKKYEALRIHKKHLKSSFKFYGHHLYNGAPLGFQFSVLEIGIIIMQAAVIAFDVAPDGSMVASLPAQMGYGAGCKVINLLMAFMSGLGTAVLSFSSQNLGAGSFKRIKQGLWVALGIGMVIYALTLLIGLGCTINGAYQYLFLSADKINSDSIRYGNMYLYVSIPCSLILMVLFIIRNLLQGIQKPLWPFLSGVGELLARSLICLYLPAVFNGGPINSEASTLAFAVVSAADPAAWIFNVLVSLGPTIYYMIKLSKKEEAQKTASLVE